MPLTKEQRRSAAMRAATRALADVAPKLRGDVIEEYGPLQISEDVSGSCPACGRSTHGTCFRLTLGNQSIRGCRECMNAARIGLYNLFEYLNDSRRDLNKKQDSECMLCGDVDGAHTVGCKHANSGR